MTDGFNFNDELVRASDEAKKGALQVNPDDAGVLNDDKKGVEDFNEKEKQEKEIFEKAMENIADVYSETMVRIVRNINEESFDVNLPFYQLHYDDYLYQLPESYPQELIDKIKTEVDNVNSEIRTYSELLKSSDKDGEKETLDDGIEIPEIYDVKKAGFSIEDLKKIHSGTMEEKKQKLKEFKEKLIEQKKVIAKVQSKLFEGVELNPDLTVEEYLESVNHLFDEFELTSKQRLAIEMGIKAYIKSHAAIKENTQEFINQETGKIDGIELYEKLFNKKPQGRVEVILRPAMIYLRVENLDDYVVATANGHIDEVTNELRDDKDRHGGCKLGYSNIRGLENAIALEKATNGKFDQPYNEEIFKHEEQHVFNAIIKNAYDAEREKFYKKIDKLEVKMKNGDPEIKQKMRDEYNENVFIEGKIKNEILAYFKGGSPVEYIRKALLSSDTLYDYGFDYKGGDLNKNEFSKQYIDLVERGISAYERLLEAGYSIEEAQNLLVVEPLTSWHQAVDRLTGKTAEQKKVERLEKAVELARKEYLEEDYEKKTAYKRVLEYFKKNNPNEGKHYEQDQDIAFYRAIYDDKLMQLRDAKAQEAMMRNASDQEIAEIYSSFLFEQKLKVQEVHDDVRAEHFDGKAFGFVRDAMLDFSKEYRSMSLGKKLSIGAGFAGLAFAGTSLAGAGVASAGAIAGMMAAKRAIMGSLAGVGIAEVLSAKNKVNKENEINQTKKSFEEALAKMTTEEKYEFLSKRTWEIAIRDEERSINEIKNKNLSHLAAGTLVGSFISTGLAGETFKMAGGYLSETSLGKLVSGGFKDVKDFFSSHLSSSSHVNGVASSEQPSAGKVDMTQRLKSVLRDPNTGKIIENYDKQTLNNAMNVNVDQPESIKAGLATEKAGTVEFGKVEGGLSSMNKVDVATDKFNHVTPSGAMNATEQAAHVKEMATAEMSKPQTVSIKEPIRIHEGGRMRHDSFIRNLKEQLKNHPGIDKDEAGHIAEVTFHDAAKEYAKAHGMNYDEAFAKLSKIHPGTTYELSWDSQGHPRVTLDDKNIKFVHSSDHHHAATHSAKIAQLKLENPISDNDVPTDETYKDWNKDVIDAANKVNEDKYNIASAISRGEVPALDPTDPNFSENLGYSKTLTEAAHSKLYNWGPSWEVGRLGEVIKQSREHMQSMLDMTDKETFTKIGKDFFDGKKSNILKFGGMKVTDALQNPDENLNGLSKKAKDLIVGYANSDATKPKPGETFKVWSYRIMKVVRETAKARNENPDYFDASGL